ncbi:hypothetical protein PTTG_07571 [Puccinia triticina 1-1 BBBD Race 1]|uniref:Uncharacterized protein n=2 Tax=Puccinia triticina TaxID=208348 RepID=A0A0C4F397_PUCT1|nr:uncharacterized protein PtA15_14A364 [Puccinia triticina]OAV94281.1 hypothetical protein PTTG_07571 [Puccinia triticina 1-1 BBBD Race 1]WAQ91480.1 hypothetical protein PtA15_14A364 [Puccinia triticina]WAR62295.1 hypothetical protein PtB15_14B390 [Puccinia triticina]
MQFSNMLTFVSLLMAISFTTKVIAVDSHNSTQPALSKVYIMRQDTHFPKGHMEIYGPDGTVLYRFVNYLQGGVAGYSMTVLSSPSWGELFALESTNDLCGHKTVHKELTHPGSPAREFKINPHGLYKDEWKFSFTDLRSSQRLSFRFDRNYRNKEGKIYARVNGHDGDEVAELKNEHRKDPWLTHDSHSVDTYTLYCTADSPQVELVTLMALVLTRVADCGI